MRLGCNEFHAVMNAWSPQVRRSAAIVAGALVTATLHFGGPLFADSIVMNNGTKMDRGVKILSAQWDKVEYQLGRVTQALDGDRVRSIVRTSSRLSALRRAAETGDVATASSAAKKAAASANDWVKAEAQYLLGRAYLAAGSLEKAQAEFEKYLKTYASSKDWFVPQATYYLGVTFLRRKQTKTANLRFDDLGAFGGLWALRGKLGKAKAILVSRDEAQYLGARRLFDEVARSSLAPAGLKQEAFVGRAQVFVAQGQAKSAIAELKQNFFQDPDPEDLAYTRERAMATLTMGRAHATLGGRENLELAEVWLLRVLGLYSNHRDVAQEACAELVDVYTKLGRKDRAAFWKKRCSAS